LLDKQAITCKWINNKKLGINGEVEWNKTRLIVRGCEYKAWIDFGKTFALVAKWNTKKAMNVLVGSKGLEFGCENNISKQMFSHDEVYM
jgi:hypothetical protein